jgi:hypothetical protein
MTRPTPSRAPPYSGRILHRSAIFCRTFRALPTFGHHFAHGLAYISQKPSEPLYFLLPPETVEASPHDA